MTHSQFVTKYLNRYVEFPGTGSAYYQCMDLMRQYIKEVWGVDPYVIPRAATAKQAYQLARTNSKIIKIANTPNGIPQQGDLVFWGTYPFVTGWAGHVAVYDKGDLYNLISFDQNYGPVGSPCKFVKHSYKGVMGWIRKRA